MAKHPPLNPQKFSRKSRKGRRKTFLENCHKNLKRKPTLTAPSPAAMPANHGISRDAALRSRAVLPSARAQSRAPPAAFAAPPRRWPKSRRAVGLAVNASTGTPEQPEKLSARQLKAALQSQAGRFDIAKFNSTSKLSNHPRSDFVFFFLSPHQGVSTADCFERADLEAKWQQLSANQRKAAAAAASSTAPGEEPAAQPSSGSRRTDASGGGGFTAPDFAGAAEAFSEAFSPLLAGPRELLQRLEAAVTEKRAEWDSGKASAGLRDAFSDWDKRLGLQAKARIASQSVRNAAAKADAALGVTPFLRTNGPKARPLPPCR